MYALNQTNALYFFPHKFSFEPHPAATDVEQYDHWSLRHHPSVAWPWAPQTSGFAPPTPKTDPADRREIDHQAQDVDRMDDDGATPYEPEPEPGKR